MTKITVAALIIGAFLVYSFVHSQSNSAALTPRLSTEAASATSASTSTSSVAAANTPTPTPPASKTSILRSDDSEEHPITRNPTPTPTTAPTAAASAPTATTTSTGQYKDGTYTGPVTDAQWGYVQVRAVVAQGKITSVQFVQYPNDRSRSQYINSIADPMLTSEAVQAQSAKVDIITGATDSSIAFIQSLTNALSQAAS